MYENLLYHIPVNQFGFEGIVYRQIECVAMGNQLGPTLADVFSSMRETELNDCISKSVLFKRFVGDMLVVTDPTNFANFRTSLIPPIPIFRFHMKNGCFNFLEIKLMRRSNEAIKRFIQGKANWGGQYLHFANCTLTAYKRGLEETLSLCQAYLQARRPPRRGKPSSHRSSQWLPREID